ncbi:PREDICTED: uncharacterized protein LOC106319796 [Brassica oleracea var. oleracea]|uniref:uncharacterized protein LOC106319796 n=1 Tax=Brassica oleracea var. oleracea TaxID=109376 RepID=UPI0006A70CF6|nr:PREDICTED: uncharacterized protein LOC106319796 [Brassica oleracea var. oleracea]
MDFCSTCTNWLMECITIVSYSFLLNDEAVGNIAPQRGIWQGDPLSLYIFIICGEILSGIKVQEDGSLPGIKVARNSPKINHLLFADDTMFFTKTDSSACSCLMSILHSYEAASGQKINALKSFISCSRKTPAEIRLRVKSQLGIDKEGGVGKYLGLPEHFGRKKKDLFASIVDIMKQRSLNWSTQFLSTAGWRLITNPECLLAKVLLGKYCHKTPFLKVSASTAISHGWRGILLGRDLLFKHLGKAVRNGESTSVWKDSWIHPKTNLRPIGPVLLKDNDLMASDLLTRETKEWNASLIDNLFPDLKDHILSLRPSVLGARDSVIWPLHKSGKYSVKSGYYSTFVSPTESALVSEDTCDWKHLIWSQHLSPKLKYFLWKIGYDALPTGRNLQRRGLLTNTNCIRYGAVEIVEHIFFHCQFAIEVWSNGPWNCQVDTTTNTSFLDILKESWKWTPLPPYGFTGNAVPWLCWSIWILRNQLLFENRT